MRYGLWNKHILIHSHSFHSDVKRYLDSRKIIKGFKTETGKCIHNATICFMKEIVRNTSLLTSYGHYKREMANFPLFARGFKND